MVEANLNTYLIENLGLESGLITPLEEETPSRFDEAREY